MSNSQVILMLVGLVFAAVIVARILTTTAKIASTKPCPHCAERIKLQATACSHCGRDVTPKETNQ